VGVREVGGGGRGGKGMREGRRAKGCVKGEGGGEWGRGETRGARGGRGGGVGLEEGDTVICEEGWKGVRKSGGKRGGESGKN